MTIRAALIGAGSIAAEHAKAFDRTPGVMLCAIVDPQRELAETLARDRGARAYSSVEEMLACEEVDLVDVCTPSFTHPEIAIRCASHGVHLLVEKPIALALADARAMIDAAHRNNVMLMVAQALRFWPEYDFLKRTHEAGTYGSLVQAWFSRVAGAPAAISNNWRADASRSGLAPFELHIHDVDFVLYLLGKPDRVQSLGVDRPDIAASFLKTRYIYESSPERIVEAEAGWWRGPVPFAGTFRVVFDDAAVIYDGETLTVFEAGANEPRVVHPTADGPTGGAFRMAHQSAITNEIAYFVNCIATGQAPSVITPEQSYGSLQLLLTELEAARTGSVLRV